MDVECIKEVGSVVRAQERQEGRVVTRKSTEDLEGEGSENADGVLV